MSRPQVILVEVEPARSPMVADLLRSADCDVTARLPGVAPLTDGRSRLRNDLVAVATARPDDRLLEGLVALQGAAPTPVVLFASDDSATSIRRAVQAGVSAYVVDGVQPHRVRPILEAAMARFRQVKALADELDRTRTQLAERKLIERAKGIIMVQRGVSEEQAYQLLRKTAMDRNKRMADIADSIVSASELLAERPALATAAPLGLG